MQWLWHPAPYLPSCEFRFRGGRWIRHQEQQKQVSDAGKMSTPQQFPASLKHRVNLLHSLSMSLAGFIHISNELNPHGSVSPPSHHVPTGSWVLLDNVYLYGGLLKGRPSSFSEKAQGPSSLSSPVYSCFERQNTAGFCFTDWSKNMSSLECLVIYIQCNYCYDCIGPVIWLFEFLPAPLFLFPNLLRVNKMHAALTEVLRSLAAEHATKRQLFLSDPSSSLFLNRPSFPCPASSQ